MQTTLNKEQSFFENNNNKKDKTLTLPGLF